VIPVQKRKSECRTTGKERKSQVKGGRKILYYRETSGQHQVTYSQSHALHIFIIDSRFLL
jgi:hypothetical protein